MPENNEEGQAENPGDVEIHLGGGESEPPTDPKAQRLRSWANIIATTAAMLTAVAAVFKPQDQTVNRNTYEQLKASIEHTNEDVKQNHEDMVAIHSYLQGYFAGSAAFAPLSSNVPTATSAQKPPNIQTAPTVTFTVPSATATATTTSYTYAPSSRTPLFPLPSLTQRPAPPTLPPFDSVAAKK